MQTKADCMTDKSYWEYHRRQYDRMYQSTASVIDFLKPWLSSRRLIVLDVGCGGGANVYWLKQVFPQCRFVGIDVDRKAIELANKLKGDENDLEFEVRNFLETDRYFGPKSFDYVLGIQLVSFVEFELPVFLKKALSLAREGVFISSLFSEGRIEQHTIAYDFEQSWEGLYKVYSIERLKETLARIAGDEVSIVLEKFEIDIDLPKPTKPRFGTYTIRTEDGYRLQASGFMLMPWYNILIKFDKGATK